MPSSAEKPGAGSTGDIHRSLGFFITLIIEHLPEGGLRISHSRWHRKGLAPIELSGEAGSKSLAAAVGAAPTGLVDRNFFRHRLSLLRGG